MGPCKFSTNEPHLEAENTGDAYFYISKKLIWQKLISLQTL